MIGISFSEFSRRSLPSSRSVLLSNRRLIFNDRLVFSQIQHTVRYTELAPTRFKSLFRD